MDEDRSFIRVPHIPQDRQKVIQIVPVNRAHIVETHLFKERSASRHAAGIFFGAACFFLKRFRKHLRDMFCKVPEPAIGAAGNQTCQVGTHRAYGRRNGHVIVVQDHNQAAVHGACIVHGLISHASAHRTVSDHSDNIVLLVLQVTANSHAKARGNRR